MQKNFSKNIKTKQYETAYIYYMLVGSYFHKAQCRNRSMENLLFMFYKEMPRAKQEKLEAKVIRTLAKSFKDYRSLFSKMNCEVHFGWADNVLMIRFQTGFESVDIAVTEEGKCYLKVTAFADEDASSAEPD